MAAPLQSPEFSPLQVPLVLKTIFEGSSLDDVKEFRKVCKSWNLESSKVLRQSAQLEFGTSEGDRPPLTLAEFMKLVDNELCVFTRKDAFPESVLFVDAEYDPRFWGRFGCHIKDLELRKATFPSPDDFRDAIFDCCPNLEELALSSIRLLGVDGPWTGFPDYDFSRKEKGPNVDEDTKGDGESTDYSKPEHQAANKNLKLLELWDFSKEDFPPPLFKRVFNHFPNLETLRVLYWDLEYQNDAIFAALDDWLQDGKGEKLKKVGLSFHGLSDPEKTVEILTSGKLRLEDLELLNFQPDRDVDATQTILEGHAATLKKLSLEGYGFDDEDDPTFPLPNGVVLGVLEELDLDVGQLESTDLWKCVPNLKELLLTDMSPSHLVNAVSIQELRDVALTSCVYVWLEGYILEEGDDQAELVRKLTALLPNVRKLLLKDCTNEVFAIAFEAFPKVVELLLINPYEESESLDFAISGLDAELVEKINREGKNGEWKPEGEPRAGLAQLKDLKILYIHSYQGLGYSSAVTGIQRLPRLEQLRLDLEKVDEETWNGVWMPLLVQYPWKGD